MVQEKREPILGLSYITEYHNVAGIVCVCQLCGVKFDHNIVFSHVTGTKHRLQYMKEKKPSYYLHLKKFGGRKSQLSAFLEELSVDVEKEEGRGTPVLKVFEKEKKLEALEKASSGDKPKVVEVGQSKVPEDFTFQNWINDELKKITDAKSKERSPSPGEGDSEFPEIPGFKFQSGQRKPPESSEHYDRGRGRHEFGEGPQDFGPDRSSDYGPRGFGSRDFGQDRGWRNEFDRERGRPSIDYPPYLERRPGYLPPHSRLPPHDLPLYGPPPHDLPPYGYPPHDLPPYGPPHLHGPTPHGDYYGRRLGNPDPYPDRYPSSDRYPPSDRYPLDRYPPAREPYLDPDPLKRVLPKPSDPYLNPDPLKRVLPLSSDPYLNPDPLKRVLSKPSEPYLDPDPLKRVLKRETEIKPVVIDYGHSKSQGQETRKPKSQAEKWEDAIEDILGSSKSKEINSLAALSNNYSSPSSRSSSSSSSPSPRKRKRDEKPSRPLPFSKPYIEGVYTGAREPQAGSSKQVGHFRRQGGPEKRFRNSRSPRRSFARSRSKSKDRVRRRSRSPRWKKSRSPRRNRSKSPKLSQRSKSPHRTRSPKHQKSKSPINPRRPKARSPLALKLTSSVSSPIRVDSESPEPVRSVLPKQVENRPQPKLMQPEKKPESQREVAESMQGARRMESTSVQPVNEPEISSHEETMQSILAETDEEIQAEKIADLLLKMSSSLASKSDAQAALKTLFSNSDLTKILTSTNTKGKSETVADRSSIASTSMDRSPLDRGGSSGMKTSLDERIRISRVSPGITIRDRVSPAPRNRDIQANIERYTQGERGRSSPSINSPYYRDRERGMHGEREVISSRDRDETSRERGRISPKEREMASPREREMSAREREILSNTNRERGRISARDREMPYSRDREAVSPRDREMLPSREREISRGRERPPRERDIFSNRERETSPSSGKPAALGRERVVFSLGGFRGYHSALSSTQLPGFGADDDDDEDDN